MGGCAWGIIWYVLLEDNDWWYARVVQSHELEFDYLKSLEIEEKINKIRWLKRKNPAHFLLSTNGEHTSASSIRFI